MKTTFKLILLYFAYQLLAGAVMAGIAQLTPIGTTTQLGWSLLLSGIAMTVHLVGFGYVNLRQAFCPISNSSILCSIVCMAATILGGSILEVLVPLPNWFENDLTALSHTVLGVFSMALLAPWVEELLFRGAILSNLRGNERSPWQGIILSALLFGLIHINPAQVLFGFLAGLTMGWLTVTTRSLWPALICHVLNNSLSVMEVLTQKQSTGNTALETLNPLALLGILAISILVLILTGQQMVRLIENE